MTSTTSPSPRRRSLPDLLCKQCAICCNGLLFQDVQLASSDPVPELRRHGLKIRSRKGAPHLLQPCAALEGNQCGCYTHRPEHCRQFECLLFQNVSRRRVTTDQALRIIRRTKRKAARVQSLMRELGQTDLHLPLARRFRLLTRTLESSPHEAAAARLYGDLTLEMHALNLLLSEAFYPEEG